MKISEMNNEQAADALIRISVPFGNICDDEKAMQMYEDFTKVSQGPLIQTVGKMLPQLVSYFLKTHKEDLYEIIGALTFQTKEQVAKMNFIETINVFKESYDEVLKSFFTSSVTETKKAEGAS